ncbi:hypothetical protein BGX38DRAFT_1224812 [Terfezia claveryi]|nr:hypothetical protein BGX38DRAFT_1224812 [Terfezia claveryi]
MKRTFDELNNTTNSNKSTSNEEPQNLETSQSPLTSTAAIASLKTTISSLPRVPQISRKVRACSACKKQKIRCDFDSDLGVTAEAAKCVRCRKMKLECVVNRSLQTILDEDVEWKMKMSEELAQLQRAVEDILRTKQMRPLSTYNSPIQSAASSCSPGLTVATLYSGNSPPISATQQSFRKDSIPTIIGPASSTAGQSPDRLTPAMRMPMTRENSPEAVPSHNVDVQACRPEDEGREAKASRPPFYDHAASLYNASLSTNPMGSLYEVTRLRSLRSNSTTNVHSHVHVHASLGSDSSEHSGPVRFTNGPSGLSRHISLSIEDSDDDLISKGLVILEEAEELFELFRSTLNHYLFDVALVHDSLSSVRNSSPLLLASILTVSSLHRPATVASSTAAARTSNSPTPSGTFAVCYQHFLSLVSSSMFEPPGGVGPHVYQNGLPPYQKALDNVRALSIAAFWLPDLSWKLSGHAVRIATELNVHQSFRKALMTTPVGSKLPEAERMRRDQERKFHYERARLWYLLYVCDHHFSIAYGRPPVICYSQHEAIRNEGYERYLESDLCKEGDFRVVSQMALFVVLERIYECFAGEISEGGMVREEVLFGTDGSDSSEEDDDDANTVAEHVHENHLDSPTKKDDTFKTDDIQDPAATRKKRKLEPPKDHRKKKRKSKAGPVEEFSRELEEWRDNWCVRLRKNAFLQLHSLALRGVTGSATNETSSADIISGFSPQRATMARVAIESAKHVLTTILTVEEIRVCLIGVPLYVHTMIAFAAVFLMKVTSRWRKVASIGDLVNPTDDVWSLVEKVIEVLRDVAGGDIKEVVLKDGKGKGSSLRKSPTTGCPNLRGAGEMHIVWYIAGGLEKMAKKYRVLVQNDDEEVENGRTHTHGKWEAVWQESSKAAQGLEGTGVSRGHHASVDAPVPPGIGGAGIMQPVEAKHEEQDYAGSGWSTQSHAFDGGHHHTHSHYDGGHDAAHNSAGAQGQTGSSTLHSYTYSSSGPDSHGMYAFDQHNIHDGHHDAHHDDISFDPVNGHLYSFSNLTPYEFFPDGSNGPSGTPTLNGGGYFSFAGFDLFGGGTMEAIPMAGAVGAPMRSDSTAGPSSGPYPQYLPPSGPAGGGH